MRIVYSKEFTLVTIKKITNMLRISLTVPCVLLVVLPVSAFHFFFHCVAPPAHAEILSKVPPRSLTLSQVIQRALQSNKTLQGAEYTLSGQQVNLDTAESEFDVKLHPQALIGKDQDGEQLGAGAKVSKKLTYGPTASISPRYGKLQDEYTGSIALALSIPLLRGLGEEIGLDTVYSNIYQLNFLRLQRRILQEDIVLQAIILVYDIINAQDQIGIYENSIKILQNELIFVKAKEQVGVATPMDIYRISISIKESEDSLVQAKNTLTQKKDRLKVLISYPFERDIHVVAPLISDEVDIDIDESIITALDNRIDIKIFDLELEEMRRRIKISEHSILPRLRLNIAYDDTSVDFFGNSILEGEERWGVRLEGDTDLSRTNERAQLIKDNLELKRKKLSLQEKIEEVKATVKNQIVSLEKSKLRYSIRQQQKIQAEGKLALANVKFRFGMSNNFDVIQSENEVQNALINLMNVRSEYTIGTYRLRKQIGTLLE